jgi:hypothetical protein
MRLIRLLATGLALIAFTAAAAANPVFPPGSRLGLTPPEEMEVSKRFAGFEAPGAAAAITFVEMPPEAYADLSTRLTAEALEGQGLKETGREKLTIEGREAFLVTGEQAVGPVTVTKLLLIASEPSVTAFVIAQAVKGSDVYSVEALRRSLVTLTVRKPLSLEDQIAALPFRLTDSAGFRPVRVLAGNSILYTEGPKDILRGPEQPVLIAASSTTPPPPPQHRDSFARSALFSAPSLREIVVERADSFRQRGSDWHEMVARAKDLDTDEDVVVTQVVRFAPNGYVRLVGIARTADRSELLPRFRRAADSVEVD